MGAVSRLLALRSEAGAAAAAAEECLVSEARELFGVSAAVLLSLAQAEDLVEVAEMDPLGDPPFDLVPVGEVAPLATLIERRLPVLAVDGDVARSVASALGVREQAAAGLLLPLQRGDSTSHVLCLFDEREPGFDAAEAEIARAFASAAAAGLAQVQMADRHAVQSARHSALVRASKALNESLEVDRTLARICEEAARILNADNAAVFVGDEREGVRIASVYGLPPDSLGTRLAPGEGLAGQVLETGEAMLTNDYRGTIQRPVGVTVDLRSGLAVPLRVGGRLSGVLGVGYTKHAIVTPEHLTLLEAFGELAAAASGNASAAAGLAQAARSDSLTGCLNHAAFHEQLRVEVERAQRAKKPLSVAMLDLDDFKRVNEDHGHPVGDEVLRRVAEALGESVRAYDSVGRYGGDEFAVVVSGASEEEAAELAGRAIAAVESALGDLPGSGRATAGVAQWDGLESGSELVDRADRPVVGGSGRRQRAEVVAPVALHGRR